MNGKNQTSSKVIPEETENEEGPKTPNRMETNDLINLDNPTRT